MIEEILKSLDKAVVTDVKVYDMRNKTPFYDYSIIAPSTNYISTHPMYGKFLYFCA